MHRLSTYLTVLNTLLLIALIMHAFHGKKGTSEYHKVIAAVDSISRVSMQHQDSAMAALSVARRVTDSTHVRIQTHRDEIILIERMDKPALVGRYLDLLRIADSLDRDGYYHNPRKSR